MRCEGSPLISGGKTLPQRRRQRRRRWLKSCRFLISGITTLKIISLHFVWLDWCTRESVIEPCWTECCQLNDCWCFTLIGLDKTLGCLTTLQFNQMLLGGANGIKFEVLLLAVKYKRHSGAVAEWSKALVWWKNKRKPNGPHPRGQGNLERGICRCTNNDIEAIQHSDLCSWCSSFSRI